MMNWGKLEIVRRSHKASEDIFLVSTRKVKRTTNRKKKSGVRELTKTLSSRMAEYGTPVYLR